MIGKLKGTIDEISEEYLIISVNDVGYVVHATSKTLRGVAIGSPIDLHIETHVREDHIQLFGFATLVEKKYFLMLISTSGVGPRVALSILSILSPSEVQLAIASQNVRAFTQVPGVGKKLAERIILELKDKIAGSKLLSTTGDNAPQAMQLANEATLVLTNLGISYGEAVSLVNAVISASGVHDLNQIVKMALQQRGN